MSEHSHILDNGEVRWHDHAFADTTAHGHGWGPNNEAAFGPGDPNWDNDQANPAFNPAAVNAPVAGQPLAQQP